jgi:hypothetical protein
MTLFLTLVIVALIGGLMFELHENRAERLEQLNRESWEVLQTARRIHDETAEAIQAMLEEARRQTQARIVGREIVK